MTTSTHALPRAAAGPTGVATVATATKEADGPKQVPDPLLCSLRCQSVPDTRQLQVLWWPSPVAPIPSSTEEELLDALVPYKKRERGMFRDQPVHRMRKLRRLCEAKRISLPTALSLRRHLMKRYNPGLGVRQLRLGSDDVILKSAQLFEEAVQDFLQRSKIAFYSEREQRAHVQKHRQPGQPHPPTPDFILKEPILIKKYTNELGGKRRVIQERSICCTWLRSTRMTVA